MISLNYLRKLEKTLENLIEGRLTETFHEKLHPMEVARKLSLAMKENRQVLGPHTYVPNVYTISLSGEDMDRFQGLSESLVSELAQYLSLEADDLDVHFLGPLRIESKGKDTLAPGEVSIESLFTLRKEGECVIRGGLVVKEGFEKGGLYFLYKDVSTLGRSDGNDICLGDPKVSGIHCQIEWKDDQAWIRDRSSRNGIMVNDRHVSEKMLEDKDEISLGFSTLLFRKLH